MQRKNITDALAGKTPIMQKVWMKALRHLIAFAIEQGECKTDPTVGIKTARPPKSSGHPTWGDVQIARYREHYANGTMARLAMELMLNIAARRHDAHLIGRQHLRNGCLSWRPSKTSQSTGKVLTIRVLPELQAAYVTTPLPPDLKPDPSRQRCAGEPILVQVIWKRRCRHERAARWVRGRMARARPVRKADVVRPGSGLPRGSVSSIGRQRTLAKVSLFAERRAFGFRRKGQGTFSGIIPTREHGGGGTGA
jgi:hypothetical protein